MLKSRFIFSFYLFSHHSLFLNRRYVTGLYGLTIVDNTALECCHPPPKIADRVCSIVTSVPCTDKAAQWGYSLQEVGKHTLHSTFHCILLTVLAPNLVIHWLNICFLDLFHIQRNVGSVLHMLLSSGLCTSQKIGLKWYQTHTGISNHTHALWSEASLPLFPGVDEHYRRQLGIMNMVNVTSLARSYVLNCSLDNSILLITGTRLR